ncbi:hypothetical protein ETAA8_52510 [Anatilimnocola aggregata]|uniref:Carboxypeptidase regulatory-like domain-containing protein n=1 Tax=Anatilimnocola aggregata TaxID=2528021 RepID=A0A517YIU1_9BACT|nr:hypothetical protein [Anatilimnocola aggregata]QDU30132.1 hypothetical protein ETAA8_52510 [Anatilimnocola aggregata]
MSVDRSFRVPQGIIAGLALLFVVAGCGPSQSGPKRYPVSGTVTFNRKPVPKGFITLEPSIEQGNSGPGGGAEIVNGKYDTTLEQGVVGGAYKVRIVGTDGVPATIEGETLADGQPLFEPYETTVEFPLEKTVKDFEVGKPAPQ